MHAHRHILQIFRFYPTKAKPFFARMLYRATPTRDIFITLHGQQLRISGNFRKKAACYVHQQPLRSNSPAVVVALHGQFAYSSIAHPQTALGCARILAYRRDKAGD